MQVLRAYVERGHWPWRQVAGDGPLGLMVRHGGRDLVDERLAGVFTLTMRANPFPPGCQRWKKSRDSKKFFDEEPWSQSKFDAGVSGD